MMIDLRRLSSSVRASLTRRLALGLLLTLLAILSGWMLSPRLAADQATVNWYTQDP